MEITTNTKLVINPMTPNEFHKKVMDHKLKAHTLFEGTGGYNIKRGMGHSISGYVEDLFAVYLASNLKRKDLIFFVDKVVSFRPNQMERAVSFKPDLLILNENAAAHYYDLKTDIGYGREMQDYLEDRNRFIKSLRGKEAWITVNNKIEHNIQFSNELKYSIVVTLGWNVEPAILQANKDYAKRLDGVDLYVLINEDKKTKTLHVNKEDFDRLISDCKY